MKLLKLILILCVFSSAVHAQFVTNSKRVGDVYFQNREYYAAAEYYKKALHISADSSGFVVPYGFENRMKQDSAKKDDYQYCVFQLAESLRGYKDFTDAEQWYAIANGFTNPAYSLSPFRYGETLRANQKFTEAIVAFNAFLTRYQKSDSYSAMAEMEIASCQFALNELNYPRLFKLRRLQNDINQKGSNYTPSEQSGNFYFTSSRPVGSSGKTEILSDRENAKVAKKESPYLNAIYEVSGNPLKESVSIKKLTATNKSNESASPAFHPNGKVVYITQWTSRGDKEIYQVNISDDKQWSEPIELPGQVNVKGYNSQQPFVSADGKCLVFSSNRPGGSGKYDLWYCPLRSDLSVGTAVNLGKTVNSAEDEQAPYLNKQGNKLLFSSNGRVGLGGFDFFESTGDLNKWSEPRNVGYPFNSSKDDMYFTPLTASEDEGYVSSDRESLCCLEVFYVKKEYLNISGILLDCNTMVPLSGATVTLSDSSQQYKVITDVAGRYTFKVDHNRGLKLKAEKDKYFAKSLNFSYAELSKDSLFSPEICITPFEIDKPIVLKDILYEFDKATLTEDSKLKLDLLYTIMIDNPAIMIELGSHTDSKGTDAYNMDLSNRRAKSCVDYLITKGIAAGRMTSRGYGESMPIAANTTSDGKDNPDGRALNRRTEFKVTKK